LKNGELITPQKYAKMNQLKKLKEQYESEGVIFVETPTPFVYKGRGIILPYLSVEKKQGQPTTHAKQADQTFVPAYNQNLEENAINDFEIQILEEQGVAAAEKNDLLKALAEMEAKLERTQNSAATSANEALEALQAKILQDADAAAKQLAEAREAAEKQLQEFTDAAKAKEVARRKPLLRLTGWFGVSLTIFIALVLVGLNFFNAQYFLGANLHWSVLFLFAILFGASFVYFALSRNSKALNMLVWVIPFDLVIATLVKPFMGKTPNLVLMGETFNYIGLVGLLLFLAVYGVQLYHAATAVSKLFNPKELTKVEEVEHLENVLNSIQ